MDKETIETRAMQLYEAWNWGTGIPWTRRNKDLQDTYRRVAADELSAEAPVVERAMP